MIQSARMTEVALPSASVAQAPQAPTTQDERTMAVLAYVLH
ncbi:MAG TPA: hypothetical protein VHW45_03325 [Candidatus Sulfotelmatobacter sp.]|nr:hypothetical protein [Candidatus Sulfotelmatobacter sp.]